MEIRPVWCRVAAKCSWCHCMVEPGQIVLLGTVFREGRFPLRFRWHIPCWVESVEDYMSKHPRIPTAGPGRPRMELGDDEKLLREKLLNQACSIRQRIRHLAKQGLFSGPRVDNLGKQLSSIGITLDRLGGRPKRWL